MDDRMNDLDRLAVLDPARGREPSLAERARSEEHLEQIMRATPAAPAPVLGARGRWMLVGAAAAVTGVAAAVVVPTLTPGATDQAEASWTAQPTTRAGDEVMSQAEACAATEVAGVTTARPQDVVLAEDRGKTTLLILRKGTKLVECLTVGDEVTAAEQLADEKSVAAPPAGTITKETDIVQGDGDDKWSESIGLAASDVTAVELQLQDGTLIGASVSSGWWAAWWPGDMYGKATVRTVITHVGSRTTTQKWTDFP